MFQDYLYLFIKETGLIRFAICLFFLVLLYFPAESPGWSQEALPAGNMLSGLAASARPGDANSDGSLNIFDLLAVLRQMRGLEQLNEAADFNKNNRADILDLIGLLQLMASLKAPAEEFQALVTIAYHKLTEPRVNPMTSWGDNGEVTANYHIYGNRKIEEVMFILGDYAVLDTQGITPVICKINPDTVDPTKSFYTEPIGWSIKTKDSQGNFFSDSGASAFLITGRMVEVNYIYPLVGSKIDFPLVLEGYWQRFKTPIIYYHYIDTLVIDLNKKAEDRVVFNDIESLAEAIMECVLSQDSLKASTKLYVSPAIEVLSGKKEDRLIFDVVGTQAYILLSAADSNEKLLQQLGFPKWIREILPPVVDYNFKLDPAWQERYKDR